MLITEDKVHEFERKGVVCLRNVFNQQWIETVAKGIEKNLKNPGPYSEWLGDSNSRFFDDYCNWKQIPEFENYVFNSPASEIAAGLTRSKRVSFYHEHVLVKEPGSTKETPWHQDQSYYPIDGDKVCSIWMPVDYVPKSTSLRFVSGSHKWGWFHPRKFATNNLYQTTKSESSDRIYKAVPDIVDDSEDYEILKWELEPGDCVVFHMKALHGAPGNESLERSRRVLSTRWLGDDAVIATRPWEVSPPIFGRLKPGERAISAEFPLVWPEGN